MTLGLSVALVGLLYAGAFLIGWRRSARGQFDLQQQLQHRRRFVDPLTARFQRWHDHVKMDALRRAQWTRLFLLFAANNFFAVALVSRTLYAVTLALPIYFTWRQGLVQGALFAMPMMRPRGDFLRVALLEFGSYLLATALGVNLVVSLVSTGSLTSGFRSLLLFYPLVAAAVLAGAWLEVRSIRDKMPAGVRIPENVNMEELRAKALEMLKQQSKGGTTGTQER